MWLTESNRPKHLKVGSLIYVMWMLYMLYFDGSLIFSSVTALGAVFLAMVSVDYGQRTAGSKFDWLDVLAGCLVPLVLTAVFCVLYFISEAIKNSVK